jgi:6-phosphofructokinase
MVKKIGILTSGGDCGGLNAVVRAATLRAINTYKWKVFGIRDGPLGLLKDPLGCF